MICEEITACAGLVEGRVLARNATECSVALGDGVVSARCAASCLLTPQEGDLALLYRRVNGTYQLLHILERESDVPMMIHAEGDLRVSCGGSLQLHGQKAVETASAQVNTVAAECVVNTESLKITSRQTEFAAGGVRVWAQKVDAVVQFLLQKLGRSIRSVETTDQNEAASICHKASELFQVESNYTVLLSDKTTRIDGEQIHMG